MTMIQDIRVICTGTLKSGQHEPTDLTVIGWYPEFNRPELEFLEYSGPTPYGKGRPKLWNRDRDFVAHGMTFRFNNCPQCRRDTPLSFTVLHDYAVALRRVGSYDTLGRLTLNLSAPPANVVST